MSKLATTSVVPTGESADSQTGQSRLTVEDSPHQIEHEVRRCLAENPGLKIDSLVVRRIDRGICLQGVVESQEITRDVCSLAKTVNGVDRVLNRLMVAPTHAVEN